MSAAPEDIAACLAAGSDPNAKNFRGWTPLHEAASGNENAAMTQALMAHGADINAQDHDGNTPLHLAAASTAFSDDAAIIALLDAGADAMRRNAQMQTPWDIAMTNEKLKRFDAYWRLNEMRFPVDAPKGPEVPAVEKPRLAH